MNVVRGCAAIYTILLIVLTMFFYSCSYQNQIIQDTGRQLLIGNEPEEAYGMYTYILFSRPPGEQNRERYLATISKFLTFSPIEEFLEYYSADSLNIIYLPITQSVTDASNADSLLMKYNYTRARVILNTIPTNVDVNLNRGGPYLISSLQPLTKAQNISKPFLVQDLSTVPPRIIELWIDEFFAESLTERTWSERTMQVLVLNLRTNIARAAEGWPVVEAAVTQFIYFFPVGSGN